ncbi:MAG: VWA domain-containing protein [Phycisphaerales bacterium]|nr:VWA domain-containing protein [Phycisphaerales bacterium]
MPITFEQPGWLLLAALIVPTWWWLLSGRDAFGRGRWFSIGIMRTILLLILAVALAQPVLEREADGLTVAVVLDRSRSIPRTQLERAVSFLEQVSEGGQREADDRLAVIQLGRDAVPTSMPDPASVISLNSGPADVTETNIAAGIEQAKGLLPRDTASRIVLVSDGNETIGNLMMAADLARESGIPIDVLPIEYEYEQEVLFDRLIAPARARLGQSIELKLLLRSNGPASGKLILERNGIVVDINGAESGQAVAIELDGGLHVEQVTVEAGDPGPVQFRATFEPDSLPGQQQDRIAANNTGSAVTFVSGSGAVLIIDDGTGTSGPLKKALDTADIKWRSMVPSDLSFGVVGMLGYDAIALVDLPRWSFNDSQIRDLHAYVHDTGGGLLMTGGPEGFGAGGWIGSALEPAIPLDMDPPAERQIVKGALVIIVHSCEIPQGNYWGQRVAEAAIETLNAVDEIGIVEKGPRTGGATWTLPMQAVGDRKAAMDAAKQLTFFDMQFFQPSMEMALTGLSQSDAGQRHVIIISDGDPQPPSQTLLNSYVSAGVTVSTVMVGWHANNPLHDAAMKRIATITGGTFHRVNDPNRLPQIFIKEARVVSRSLIQEGTFSTQVVDAMSGPIQGISELPAVRGYVLAAEREGLARTGAVVINGEYQDPLYAWWNYGLGRVIAFTSDLAGRWTGSWASWARLNAFWEQSTRWLVRSSSRSDFAINTRDQGGGQFIVEMEAYDPDAAFLNFLETRAAVIGPDGETTSLDLQQIAPGRYRGEFQQRQAGNSVVNVHFAGRDSEGETIEGNVQAAVSRAYSDEYRNLVDNAALLRRVAKETGGRVIEMDDLVPLDLYDRESLVMPSTAREIWMTLAIIAAILLVLDVALRRLTVDPERVKEVLARASAGRQQGGDASVSAWKRMKKSASPRVSVKREDLISGTERSGSSISTVESSSDEASVSGKVEPEPPVEDEGGMTSRLKAARDRARRGDFEDGDS